MSLVSCRACGETSVRIPRPARLNRLIAQALVRKPTRLTAGEARFLRGRLGLSSREFATRMGVTPETVSRWESRSSESRRPLGGPAERALRLLVVIEDAIEDFAAEVLDEVGDIDGPALVLRLDFRANRWRERLAA